MYKDMLYAYFFIEVFILNFKNKLYLEIALGINKDLYEDKIIDYYTYRVVEDKLLQSIKRER